HAAPLQAIQGVDVHIDASVLAFTTGLALLTGVAFGVAPALAASDPNLLNRVKSGAVQTGVPAHRARLRESLVVTELAAALVLLIGAGLLTRSLLKLLAVDLGVRPDHVLGVYLGRLPNGNDLPGRGSSGAYAVLLERLAALPGVASVALTDALPLGGFASSSTVRVDDAPPVADGGRDAALSAVSPEYFNTLGVQLIAGRAFSSADRVDAAPVAIVNTAFARQFLRGGGACSGCGRYGRSDGFPRSPPHQKDRCARGPWRGARRRGQAGAGRGRAARGPRHGHRRDRRGRSRQGAQESAVRRDRHRRGDVPGRPVAPRRRRSGRGGGARAPGAEGRSDVGSAM